MQWLINENDLLHLFSVKIGAAYVSVSDASKRTAIPVSRATPSPGKAEAERWQPIETAPKDREIWAFNGEQGRMQWSEGSADNGEGWALWVWCDQLLSDADPDPEQPTHWMPLPAAPGAIQQERDK
jgi:hypothetical protein